MKPRRILTNRGCSAGHTLDSRGNRVSRRAAASRHLSLEPRTCCQVRRPRSRVAGCMNRRRSCSSRGAWSPTEVVFHTSRVTAEAVSCAVHGPSPKLRLVRVHESLPKLLITRVYGRPPKWSSTLHASLPKPCRVRCTQCTPKQTLQVTHHPTLQAEQAGGGHRKAALKEAQWVRSVSLKKARLSTSLQR
jgi:hypothetical protein